jgi:hypothetical protein
MSDMAVTGSRAVRPGLPRGATAAWEAPDARRALQMCLGAVWLLDAILQYQSWMFTRAFGQMLAGSAVGNPAAIAHPITWSAGIIEHHPVPANAVFATIQLVLALGIAWRPAVKIALGASIAWSLAVWWLGEGLGSVLAGGASPVNGAPGAVTIYALLAVLLWPADRSGPPASFVAARPLGARAARALWLAVWGSLAYLTLLPGNRAAQGLHDMISGMAAGEPGWLSSLDANAAALLAHQGLTASIILAAVLAVIAVGVYLPAPAARAILVLAIVTAGAIWVFGQALGEIFTGTATDPNSGPLLALLAIAYWPARATIHRAAAAGAAHAGTAAAASPSDRHPGPTGGQ